MFPHPPGRWFLDPSKDIAPSCPSFFPSVSLSLPSFLLIRNRLAEALVFLLSSYVAPYLLFVTYCIGKLILLRRVKKKLFCTAMCEFFIEPPPDTQGTERQGERGIWVAVCCYLL